MHLAPGPQGLGLHGSGISMQRCSRHTSPRLHSKSATHSGPQPVIVSGFGINPGLHWQIALPGGDLEHFERLIMSPSHQLS